MAETFWVADVYGDPATLCDKHAMEALEDLAFLFPEFKEAGSPAGALAILDAMRVMAGKPDIPLPYREGEGPCGACEELKGDAA